MSRRSRGWQWTPASTQNHTTGQKAKTSGGTFEEEIEALGQVYWLQKIAKWKKVDPHRVKTRRGIISLENPFLDFIGTAAPGIPLWFEAKSTMAPYLDISGDEKTRGLKQSQISIIKDQVALGAKPFLLWEYRWKESPFSKVMFIPHTTILGGETRLNAADWPNIRRGSTDILVIETFKQHHGQ